LSRVLQPSKVDLNSSGPRTKDLMKSLGKWRFIDIKTWFEMFSEENTPISTDVYFENFTINFKVVLFYYPQSTVVSRLIHYRGTDKGLLRKVYSGFDHESTQESQGKRNDLNNKRSRPTDVDAGRVLRMT